MTTDERVDDIMRRLFIWIEAGAQKPFRWNGEVFDFVYLDDEGLRRFLITKIVEAGRQDGAEEMREKCAKIAERRAVTDRGVGLLQFEAQRIANEIRARSGRKGNDETND